MALEHHDGVRQLSLPAALAPLVLASGSPRRTDLLSTAGWLHEVAPVDVDETIEPGEEPGSAARRLAERKARAGASGRDAGAVMGTVLGADTIVVVGDCILGKPDDIESARVMLGSLSGRRHQVISAVALVHVTSGKLVSGVAVSDVDFDGLDDATLQRYLDGGEWRGKAGAYAIQGDAAAFAHLETGALDTVIGLPMDLVETLAARLEAHLCAA
jgi:septum formation protein